ncbi:MAG: NADH-ubiquinone oxidoreductase-F iron-sulfur binding region domain-containing protein [bacterium]
MKLTSIQKLHELHKKLSKGFAQEKTTVAVCTGTGCRANRAMEVLAAFKRELGEDNVSILKETGCHGLCEKGPLVVIRPENIFYQNVQPEAVHDIVEKTIRGGEILHDLLYQIPGTDKKVVREDEVPFYKGQTRLVFKYNGHIDPKSIEDYIGVGGYLALAKVLAEMSPEDVIEEVERSKLRGRGGGGFPAGKKWRSCRHAFGHRKFVICNADEGDPGAYMDRSVLEGNPHSVIEGMIIGAYAVGSHEGYVYVRAEYPLAVKHLWIALDNARSLGLLGKNILGTDHSFDIKINKGGGAFVCGESTALMQSIEGKVGEPRIKYIHTVESGLYEMPTTLNNVETWANVPIVINHGAEWYNTIGTAGSKGTKLFSLVGKVVNTGLVEVPMGISLKELIFDIGGGIPNGKKFKAIQTGGPSGGCIPNEKLDIRLDMPVDFDELFKVGSMMGSGGMIVMDEDTCMVDVARYFLSFSQSESCGKCTPCREGTRHMLNILTDITKGKGEEGDIELLETMSRSIANTSLCALGGTAPNPVLTTIKYFREEYEVHIRDKKCPAKQCKALIRYSILGDKCTGCTVCAKKCPAGAIRGERKKVHVIDPEKCIKCGICESGCKFGAVRVES